jgi:hypothetical protein
VLSLVLGFKAMTDRQFKAFLSATDSLPELIDKLRLASHTKDLVAIAESSGRMISVGEVARAIYYAMLHPGSIEIHCADDKRPTFNSGLT